MTLLWSLLPTLLSILLYLSEVATVPLPGQHPGFYCTYSHLFVTPFFNPRDCTAALGRFVGQVEREYGLEEYEFLPPTWHREPVLRNQRRTPLRWVSGTCTVAIVTMSGFRPGELPELPYIERAASSDTSTFPDLKYWAQMASSHCMGRLSGNETSRQAEDGGVDFVSRTGFAVLGRVGPVLPISCPRNRNQSGDSRHHVLFLRHWQQ